MSLVIPSTSAFAASGGAYITIPAGAAPWTPASIPNLAEWWTASEGVTLASGNVSQWIGQVAGTVVSQATSGSRPGFAASASPLNGKPAIDTRTTPGFLSAAIAQSALLTGESASMFVVMVPEAGGSQAGMGVFSGSAQWGEHADLTILPYVDSNFYDSFFSTTRQQFSPGMLGQPMLYVVTSSPDGWYAYIDGEQVMYAANTPGAGTSPFDFFGISGSAYWQGLCAQVGWSNGVMSTSDMASMLTYASAYGVVPASPGPGATVNHVISNGQSLNEGVEGTPVLTTTSNANAKALNDSSGTYDITNPYANTLSLVQANAPVRPLNTTDTEAQYPNDICGEVPDSRLIDQMCANASGSVWMASTTGAGEANYLDIEKGGAENCYAAGIYEAQAAHILTRGTAPHVVRAVCLEHGEIDALDQTPQANYETFLTSMQADYQDDCQAVTVQTSAIPLIFFQQNSQPPVGFGTDTSTLAMNTVANGTTLVMGGPKYQYTYYEDGTHLINTAYRLHGEKRAQVLTALMNNGSWTPLKPTSFTVSGQTCVIGFAVRVPPLVIDTTTLPAGHQSGAYTAWADGAGFESYDSTNAASNFASVTYSGDSVWTVTYNAPHGYTTGQTVNFRNHSFSNEITYNYFNAPWVVTVTSPTTLTLDGSTPSLYGGTWSSNAIAESFRTLTVTASIASSTSVLLSFDRVPASDLVVAYAWTSDLPYDTSTGGVYGGGSTLGQGRFGNLRDSDTYAGISGIVQPNWCISFSQYGVA